MSTKLCKAYLGVGLVVVLLGPDPPGREMVLHGRGQGHVVVAGGGDVAVLDQGVVEVPVEARLHVRDVLDGGQGLHRDLLLAVRVGHGGGHLGGVDGFSGLGSK